VISETGIDDDELDVGCPVLVRPGITCIATEGLVSDVT
jgi:hypothetical protein